MAFFAFCIIVIMEVLLVTALIKGPWGENFLSLGGGKNLPRKGKRWLLPAGSCSWSRMGSPSAGIGKLTTRQ